MFEKFAYWNISWWIFKERPLFVDCFNMNWERILIWFVQMVRLVTNTMIWLPRFLWGYEFLEMSNVLGGTSGDHWDWFKCNIRCHVTTRAGVGTHSKARQRFVGQSLLLRKQMFTAWCNEVELTCTALREAAQTSRSNTSD